MSAYQYVYHMDKLSKTYPGGKQVFAGISLHFLPDAKIGVVGVNGAGKSSLLRIMAGQDTDFTGEAWAEKGVRVGYLPQEPKLDEAKTVWENVIEGSEDKQIYDAYNAIAMELAEDYSDELMEKMTALQEQVDARDAWDIDSKIEMAMEALRCPPGEAAVTNLSGGEVRRVALCRLLLSKPDMLLLDEPTNHLDAESVAWLQHHLEQYPGAVLIVTHDRYFLDSITTWTLELDRGQGIPYQGGYSAWLEQKAKRLEQEAREESAKSRALTRELEWIRSSPKARQAKSKARINAYEEKRDQAEKEKISTAVIRIPPGPRLGGNVVAFEDVSKGFGDKLLIDGLTFKLPPGGVVGVIGPNGAGKSTLFRMIIGEEQPDSGSITLGETVKLGYVNQSRDALDANKNVWEEISGGNDMIDLGGREVPSRAYVVQLQGRRPAEEGRRAFGRRAQPRASGQDAERGRQPAAARRTDQRSGRGDPVRAGSRAGGLPRLRGGHLPRPLLPGPHRHPHPRLRRRQPRGMVRRRVLGLSRRQEAPSGPRRGRAQAHQVPEVRTLAVRRFTGGREKGRALRGSGLFRCECQAVQACASVPATAPWQCLNFLPDPQGHCSLRPTLPHVEGSAGSRSV
jgi:ATP-binding cassette ChvD family protein